MNLKRSALSLALWAALPAFATTAVELDGVTVVGTRPEPVPTPAAQLDDQRLTEQRYRAVDSAELLRQVPGVDLRASGGTSSMPMIFGLGGDRVRTRLDGMDLIASCPNHMNPPLSYLDPAAIGRITVYAGITPVSAGGDSIAGSVVVSTHAPVFSDSGVDPVWHTDTGLGYRDNGNAWRSHLTLSFAGEQLAMNYSGAHAEADNYRAGGAFRSSTATGRVDHTLPLDVVGSSAYETTNHAFTLALRGRSQLVEARLGYQDTPFQGYPNQRMDMTSNRQQRAALRYLAELAVGTLEARGYHETVTHEMDFGPDRRYWYGSNSGAGSPCSPIRFMGDPAGSCAAGMPMNSDSTTTGAALNLDLPLQTSDLARFGLELQRYRLDDYWPASGGGMGPGIFRNIAEGERDRSALFAEWEAHPAAAWTTMLGVRFERVRTDAGPVRGYSTAAMAMGNQAAEAAAFNALDREQIDHHWNLAASARYDISAQQALEFGLARRVRSPNLYERYTWSTWSMAAAMNNVVGDGNGYVGNPALRPETAWTSSLSWRWRSRDDQSNIAVTPFYTRVNDYIDAVATTGFRDHQFNVLRWANQSARLWGVNVSAQTRLLDRPWLGQLDLAARLEWQRGINDEAHDYLYQQMPENGSFSLIHSKGRWNAQLEWELVSAKTRISAVHTEVPTDGYGLLHLRTAYAWEHLSLDAGVENLMDHRYALPLGGSYVGQGMAMSLNGIPWGIAVPGAGRTLYAGLRLHW